MTLSFAPERIEQWPLDRLKPGDALTVPLQLQMIPSEMLPLSRNEVLTGGAIRQGIEFDRIGRRVAYASSAATRAT